MAVGDAQVYVLDRNDCLVRVGTAWDSAAVANGAPELCAARALGTSLWSYIGDPTTAELYRLILNRVRAGRLVNVPFDGSGPGVLREMRLHLRALPGDHVECTSTVVREQWLGAVGSRAADALLAPVRLTVCSWCGRMRVEAEWRDVDVAVATLRVFMATAPTPISHGACPACAARLVEDVHDGD